MLAPFLTTLAAVALVVANPHGHAQVHRHQALARRAEGHLQVLSKRFSNARLTFYDVGLGACGKTNVPSDFIVALNSDQYGSGYPGPNCFKKIKITYGGKSTTATIMDECPGCPPLGLDLSRGLFDYFASESLGVLYAEWEFEDGSGGDDGDDQPTTTKHTTTHHTTTTYWTPTTTTHSTTTKTTKTSTWSSSTSKSTSKSSSTSHSYSSSASASASFSINFSSGIASGVAIPTGSASAAASETTGELSQFNLAMVYLGGLINAAGQAED